MADYVLRSDADDVITGTSGADTVSGPTGGIDHISTGGGNDRITIGRDVSISYYSFAENDLYWQEWFFHGAGQQFSGTIDGGSGTDTLRVQLNNVLNVWHGFEMTSRDYDVFFSLKNATITGVEYLEIANDIELSIAQLNLFQKISTFGTYHTLIKLFGPGGELDFQSMAEEGSVINVDARSLTSGLTYIAGVHENTVTFGSFDDTYVYTGGKDTVAGGAGVDTLVLGWSKADPLVFSARPPALNHTIGSDLTFKQFENFHVTGGSGDDKLHGLAGDDIFDGRGGNDILDGGDVDDILYGGAGDDILYGRQGPVPDFQGADKLYGGSGDDRIYAAGDMAHGGDGNDTIIGTQGGTVIRGDRGRDNLLTYGGDEVYGGEGNDRISFHGFGSVIRAGDGDDLIQAFKNPLRGWGDSGEANHLYGDAGDDTIVSGALGDHMYGGEGNDTFVVTNTKAIVHELAGQGTDTVEVRFGYVLAEHVENLVLTDAANANGWGNAEDNVITGNAGDNLMTGLRGADDLSGGGGADTFRYVSLADSNASGGIDRILDFSFAEGDRVDVSAIDANPLMPGNQAFDTMIAADAAFTEAGQFRFLKQGDSYLAEFNVNGNPAAELAIRFESVDPPEESWFML